MWTRSLAALLALSSFGCMAEEDAQNPENADGQFDDGVAVPGKTDTLGYEDRGYAATCILRAANGASEQALTDDAGMWSRSARRIVEARNGADGQPGTDDDVVFDTLEGLDDVDWVGYFAFSALFSYAEGTGLCPGLGEEYEHAGEQEATDLIIEQIGARMRRRYEEGARPSTRGLHAKGRCLDAEVTIDNGALPPELRVGLFADNTTHPAIVRFSNGDPHVQADREGDVRAMAIKVLDVPGEKLLEAERDATTHDFLLNHTPAVATADVIHFAAVIDHAENGRNPALAFLDWNPFDIELSSILLAIEAITTPIVNPLSTPYWSQTPYRLGPDTSAVKYRARPCDGEVPGPEVSDERCPVPKSPMTTPSTSMRRCSSSSRLGMFALNLGCSGRRIRSECRSKTPRSSGPKPNLHFSRSRASCSRRRISPAPNRLRCASTSRTRLGTPCRSTGP
ncbi:MAG: hypothetical protein AAGA54_15745 [Myxococcota bacterium]